MNKRKLYALALIFSSVLFLSKPCLADDGSGVTEEVRKMFTSIDVVELNEPAEIFPAYQHAIERKDNKSTLLIEHGNFYNQK